MTPLYEEVGHLYTRTAGLRIRAWAPLEICPYGLITPSRVIPSLKPTTGHVMGQHTLSRQGNGDGISKRERGFLHIVTDSHTQH